MTLSKRFVYYHCYMQFSLIGSFVMRVYVECNLFVACYLLTYLLLHRMAVTIVKTLMSKKTETGWLMLSCVT